MVFGRLVHFGGPQKLTGMRESVSRNGFVHKIMQFTDGIIGIKDK